MIFVQQVVNGLLLGGQYTLFALGLTVVYGMFGVINLAHGSIFMMSALVCYLLTVMGINYFLAVILSMASMLVLMVILERVIFFPMRDSALGLLVTSMALMTIIDSFAVVHLTNPTMDFIDTGIPNDRISLFGIDFNLVRLIIFGVAAVVVIALALFFRHTRVGKAIRAVVQNRESATALGISPSRMSMFVFALSGALAGLAGSLMGAMVVVSTSMGSAPLMKGLVIIILGGLGSMGGSIIGSMIIGVLETLGAYYIGGPYVGAIPFAILIIIMLIKPQGLFGRKAGI